MENELHLHKCGFPYHETEGCGYVWEHASDSTSNADYVAKHTCPKCGKVMPMFAQHFWQFHPDVERARNDMPEKAFELLALVNSLPDTA